jgi:putative thiamine transport system substrate-binding protein
MAALLDYARANPGRFAYPAPPDFTGTTFLKQALHDLAADPAALAAAPDDATFEATTAPLWAFLDGLHPALWRGGAAWPASGPQLRAMMADGEVDLAFSFNANEAATAIAGGQLPDTVRAYVFEGGSIGNVHFVAIPFNATAKAGAMAVADFLLSPEAQARKADPAVWGDGTVLAVADLPAEARALFDAIDYGVGALAPADLGAALPEPHPDWMTRIEAEWSRRYGAGR